MEHRKELGHSKQGLNHMMKDFSSWKEYTGASEGSGRSEKVWLVNPENDDIGLFKFTKTEETTEHISEKVATELAQLIGIECMKVDIGVYDSRIGSLSYKINVDDENLIEGVRLINKYYPYYNPDTLYDEEKNERYSLEMILGSLQEYDFRMDFLKIVIFDFLIGNTDRHQNNWAILQKDKEMQLCPLYDNGSSLCCYIQEEQIDSYLGNDKVRFGSLVNSKSTSRISIDKHRKKEPTHLQVLIYLRDHYYDDIIDMITKISYTINKDSVGRILDAYEGAMSEKRITLIKRFLIEKVKLMSEQFNIGKEE